MNPVTEHMIGCVRLTAADPAPEKERDSAPAEMSYVVEMAPVNCKLVHAVDLACSSRRLSDGLK